MSVRIVFGGKKKAGMLACLFLLSCWTLPLPAVRAAETTSKQNAWAEAVTLFNQKKFADAEKAFAQLEQAHPDNSLIKRYLASIAQAQGRTEDAMSKLREALTLNSEDWIAGQMLSDLYFKQGRYEDAQRAYQGIVDGDAPEHLKEYARGKLAVLEEMKSGDQASTPGERMSFQDFMQSEPAQLFSKGNYQKALSGFEALESQYPRDPLIRRFHGMTLLRLSQPKKALAVLREGADLFPSNPAMRLYLGYALSAQGKPEEARKEFRWVAGHDLGSYRYQAQQAMFYTLRQPSARPAKPWTVNFTNTYDYDNNAAFKSRDHSYSTAGDQNSGRYSTLFLGTYKMLQKGSWSLTPDVLYAQSLYDDLSRLNTYTPGMGLSSLYGFRFFGKPAYWNLRDGITGTFLKDRFYAFINTLSNSLIYSWSSQFRSTLTHRWTVNEYRDDGTVTERTSRDGYGNSFSINNTHYLNAKRNLFYSFGYEFERGDTKGVDYIKNANSGKFSIHFPLFEKVEAETAYVFKDSDYPKYGSSIPKRRDDVHTLAVTLSRPIFPWLILSTIYTFEESQAKNNAFEYIRHMFSVKLAAQY